MERYTILEDVEVLNLVKSLVLERKYDVLAIFLDNLSEMRKKDLMRLDEFCRSMIAFHLEKREFDRVYSILETGHFTNSDDLIEIWDQAHYREREEIIQRPLNSLMRFRIRKKYPPPRNICPSGQRPQHKLPAEARGILKEWFAQHQHNPYPSKPQREGLCQDTGLTDYQVKTWFSNARRKVKDRSPGNKKATINNHSHLSQTTALKPQLYLRPNSAPAFDHGNWRCEWNTSDPLQNLQDWQRKTLGGPFPQVSQDKTLQYEARYWPTEDFQDQCFKEPVYPGNNALCVTEPCYYGNTCNQPLTYQFPTTNQFCRQCCLRESYESSFYNPCSRNEIQQGDTEAAMMLLDLQRPLISGEMDPQGMKISGEMAPQDMN
uniref:Uncharacterized protein LOC111121426 n=1 Tax=Crassostrea virginica TaxID=6565 RepID=A0A8B8CRR0_CRAVI|nr:uncharacterized protein LOC111121426 [Crassostrea virginica]